MKKHLVGTCVDSFDEDGNCLVPQLPFDTASDLGYADENAIGMTRKEFMEKVELDPETKKRVVERRKLLYMRYKDLLMLYDPEDDIHYFFV